MLVFGLNRDVQNVVILEVRLLANWVPLNELLQCISGLPASRINLSPFTKDYRAGGHYMRIK
jgi:hypothetical protein